MRSSVKDLTAVWCSEDRAQRSSGAVLANAEEGRWTAGREDSDAAASIEVPIHDCKKPTCIHVDEIAGKPHAQSVILILGLPTDQASLQLTLYSCIKPAASRILWNSMLLQPKLTMQYRPRCVYSCDGISDAYIHEYCKIAW